MSRLNRRLAAPLSLLAAMALTLAAVSPGLAAPGSDADVRPLLAQPEECDEITTGAEGGIVVGGEPLTDAQAASLGPDVVAALMLAAAPDTGGVDVADICLDVEIVDGTVTVTGTVQICIAMVQVDEAGNVSVGGIPISTELLSADLLPVLRAAAAADVDACFQAEVTENEVVVVVQVGTCVTATMNNDGSVTVVLGGVDILFPDGSIEDLEGVLQGAAGLEVGLFIVARLTTGTDELVLEGFVPEQFDCGPGRGFGQVVIDKAVDADGDRGTFGDLEDGGPGWTFDFAITDGEVLDEFPTTNEDSDAYFSYTTTGSAPVITVTERLPDGWEVLEASCMDESNGEPLGDWTGAEVSFTAEPEGGYICFFVNSPTGTEPTASPTAAPTADGAPATERPTITQPPTDRSGPRTPAVPDWPILLAVYVSLLAGSALLLAGSGIRGRGEA